MKVITASTIGNLIYDEAGEERSARIIRKRIDGTYKNEAQVTLD